MCRAYVPFHRTQSLCRLWPLTVRQTERLEASTRALTADGTLLYMSLQIMHAVLFCSCKGAHASTAFNLQCSDACPRANRRRPSLQVSTKPDAACMLLRSARMLAAPHTEVCLSWGCRQLRSTIPSPQLVGCICSLAGYRKTAGSCLLYVKAREFDKFFALHNQGWHTLEE